MNLSRIDARFLLPEPLQTAYAADQEWTESLLATGVRLAQINGPPQAAIGPSNLLPALLASGAPMVLVEGRGAAGLLHRHGYQVQYYLALPNPQRPLLLLPVADDHVAAYGVRTCVNPQTVAKAVRKRLVSSVLSHGLLPPVRSVVTIALRHPQKPFLVSAAQDLGLPSGSKWFLLNGSGDSLSRGLFFLFPPGAPEPEWVLKFARVPGYRASFDRDEHGLSLAATSGALAASHAPKLIGRVEVGGTHAALETAARGRRLDDFIGAPVGSRVKREAIDQVAEWTLDLARSTASPPDRLAAERARLNALASEIGKSMPTVTGLVESLPPIPAVLQHNDLGAWNVIVHGTGFTAVDWESAQRFGLPLWDLWYFLASALARLERVEDDALQTFLARLFRGDAPTSPILFRWTRRAVDSLGIPAEAVAACASLCWLHHSQSHLTRVEAVRQHAPGTSARRFAIDAMPAVWFTDPALGPSWRSWSE